MTGAEIEFAVQAARLEPLPPGTSSKFEKYLALLAKWNAKLNLTAIREPSEIVRRHFLESIECARVLPSVVDLLDFGSGGGFPGIPVAILRPEIRVVLGESQAKKSSFLREVARTLDLNLSVFDGRLETMKPGSLFGAITLRAVDKMPEACKIAENLLATKGIVAVFATETTQESIKQAFNSIGWADSIPLSSLDAGFLMLGTKSA